MPENDHVGNEGPAHFPNYDRDLLYDKLNEIQGYLAELRYIDDALTYIAEQEVTVTESLAEAGFAYGGSMGMSIEPLTVAFGHTFPFTKEYFVASDIVSSIFSSPAAKIESHLEELAGQANQWAASEVASVANRIEPFTSVPVSLYDTHVISPLVGVLYDLQDKVPTDFGKLDYSLGEWKGDAAEGFSSSFYTPFQDTLPSQQRMVEALITGVASAKLIMDATQHSLMSVVEEVWQALREQLHLRQLHAGLVREETKRNAYILASGVGTILAGLAGGSLWGAGLALLSGGSGIASIAIPDGGHAVFELLGASAEELLGALSEAARATDLNFGAQQEELAEAVGRTLERVEELLAGPDGGEDGRLVLARPAIIDGVDGETFYLPS